MVHLATSPLLRQRRLFEHLTEELSSVFFGWFIVLNIRNIPLLGRVMSEAGFLFLDRNWETDNKNINDYMSHFTQADRDDWLLIFPEGTIRHESISSLLLPSLDTLQVSHAYAQKTHRPLLDVCLSALLQF